MQIIVSKQVHRRVVLKKRGESILSANVIIPGLERAPRVTKLSWLAFAFIHVLPTKEPHPSMMHSSSGTCLILCCVLLSQRTSKQPS